MELAKLKSSINTIFKCPICYEDFSEKHEPMIIPCGHTICINCVTQIIKVSEEEIEDNYSNGSAENEENNYISEEADLSSEFLNSNGDSNSNENSENSENENTEESEENCNEESEDTEDIPINLEHNSAGNIKHFEFDIDNMKDEFQNKFLMENNDNGIKNSNEEGKLIKLKCSLCRKKMKINSKRIMKNFQLTELMGSLSKLQKDKDNENDKDNFKEISEGQINKINDNDNDSVLNNKKIFCNICQNIFSYREHKESLKEISDLHLQNFTFIDENLFQNLENFFINENENIGEIIPQKNTNFINSDILKEEIFKEKINKIFIEKISDFKTTEEIQAEITSIENFLMKFIALNTNFSLSENELFDFFDEKNQIFSQEKLEKNSKNSKIYNYLKKDSDAFSAFKKVKDLLFTKLIKIFIEFEESSGKDSENIMSKGEKLLKKYFRTFKSLYKNFKLHIEGKIILQNKNSLDENSTNEISYYSSSFKENFENLLTRRSNEIVENYLKNGFFSSYLNNTIFSEKRFTIKLYNQEYNKKCKLYIYDSIFEENTYAMGFKNLSIVDELNPSVKKKLKLENVFTKNLLYDEQELLIYFLGLNEISSNEFRVYDMKNRELIKLPKIPFNFWLIDSILYDGKIFVCGGTDETDQAIRECFYYDIKTQIWEKMPNLKIGRNRKSLFIRKNKIYTYGGVESDEGDLRERNDITVTQLWKFEVFDLNNLNKKNEEFVWKLEEIKDFNYKISEFAYGLINENDLLIIGGLMEDSMNYSKRGFIIDLENKVIREHLKLNEEINNQNMSTNFYRGKTYGHLDEDENKCYSYIRNFDNLNIFI